MKYIYLVLTISLFVTVSSAQIEVGVETLPEAGDILEYVTFDYTGDTLSYRQEGEAQVWVFSEFEFTGEEQDTFRDIANTEYVDSFPNADLMFNTIGFQAAAKRNTNSIELLGIVSPEIDFLDLSGISLFDSPFDYRRAPINFGDSFEDDARLFFQFSAEVIPGVDSLELPIPGATLDSIRFVVEISKKETTVGWGTMELDATEHEVLMIKQEDNFENTLEVGLNLFDNIVWFDASEFFGAGGDTGLGLGFNSTITYKYLNADSKESIIEFSEQRTVDTLGVSSLAVSGRIAEGFVTEVNEIVLQVENFKISPNPSEGLIQVICDSDVIIQPNLTIRNMKGEKIWSVKNYSYGDNIDVTNLPKGLYLMEWEDGGKRQTQKFLIQ